MRDATGCRQTAYGKSKKRSDANRHSDAGDAACITGGSPAVPLTAPIVRTRTSDEGITIGHRAVRRSGNAARTGRTPTDTSPCGEYRSTRRSTTLCARPWITTTPRSTSWPPCRARRPSTLTPCPLTCNAKPAPRRRPRQHRGIRTADDPASTRHRMDGDQPRRPFHRAGRQVRRGGSRRCGCARDAGVLVAARWGAAG